MLAKLSAFSWMMIAVFCAAEQFLGGEGVGRRHQLRRAVLAHLQRRQVAAGGMAAVARHLEVAARGVEVAGRAAGRGDRVGLALAHRVDVQAVEAGRQLARRGGLHRDGGEAARELDVGGGHRGAVGELQLGGELLAAGGLGSRLVRPPPSPAARRATASRSRPPAWCRARWRRVRWDCRRSTRGRERRTRRRRRRA